MEAISVLHAEHEGVLVVLTQLERAVAAAERALPVPADVFTDIGEFFSVFVDRCHHSKEEAVVFPRLAGSAQGDVASHLEEEHGRGRELATAYAAAVRGYTPGDTASGQRLAAAARAYAAFLREHIDEEDRDLSRRWRELWPPTTRRCSPPASRSRRKRSAPAPMSACTA